MNQYVALISDFTGRYANVLVYAKTWEQATDQLEDFGCEVIEDQSEDYEDCFPEEFKDLGVFTVKELIRKTDFVSHN